MFETLLIKPLYNGFIALIGIVPGGDVGISIILLTILLRAIFFPVFSQGIRTQIIMRRINPELEAIKEKYKKDPAQRAKLTMEVMKKNKARPFASFLAALIQLPVFIALYIVFLREGLPELAHHLLYSFTPLPDVIQTTFLGFLQLTAPHNISLAALVGLAQHLQGRLTFARSANAPTPEGISKERLEVMKVQESVQRVMFTYFLPFLMASVAYSFPAVAGLYLITGSIFSIVQELYIKKRLDTIAPVAST